MTLTNQEAISQAFNKINEFKRYRVLAEEARRNGNTSTAIFNELKMYKAFDSIELYVRVLNKNERNIAVEEDSE